GGNTTTRPGTASQTLSWDAEGRLASVTDGTATTSYVYDADGNRLLRRDPAGTTLYLGLMELRAAQSGALSCTRYYHYGSSLVAVRTAAGLSWLSSDLQGTPDLAVSAADGSATRRRFSPYGEPRGTAGTWPGERGFVGGTTDPSTGLTHLGVREYDPAT